MRIIQNVNRKGASKGYRNIIDQKTHINLEEFLQTTGTELLPSSPEDDSKVSQASYAKIASSNLPNNVTTPLPQEEYPQVSGSTFQFSELVEKISSRIEILPFLQKFPFVTYAMRMSEYERNDGDLSVCGRNSDGFLRKAPGSNKQRIALRLHGQTENLRKCDGGTTSGQTENLIKYDGSITSGQTENSFKNQNQLHSSGKIEESVIVSERGLNDQRMEGTISEILDTNRTNSVHLLNSKYIDFRCHSPLQDISLKSRPLCPEVHRSNDNDFSIRIFAHIAFLNNVFFKSPPFYSNMNVEKVVQCAWMGIEANILNQTKFQIIDNDKLQQLLFDCRWSLFRKESFDLFKFLSYCAMICQIGVQAMNCQVEKVPSYVATFLRNIIEVENTRPSCFECNVEKNADKIVESFRL